MKYCRLCGVVSGSVDENNHVPLSLMKLMHDLLVAVECKTGPLHSAGFCYQFNYMSLVNYQIPGVFNELIWPYECITDNEPEQWMLATLSRMQSNFFSMSVSASNAAYNILATNC